MKFIVAALLTALLAFIGGLFFDWWILAVAALLVAALVHQRAGKAFLAGFTGGFLLWGLLSFWIDSKNDGILSVKIAQLFYLGNSSGLLILVTALIAGLVGGMAALSGSYLRSAK